MAADPASYEERYARHLVLPDIGADGQAKLAAAKVLVVGAGGLGSPLILYLAAAGVGTLGIVEDDRVDLSNLQRQVIHGTSDVGRPKGDSAAETVAAINPDVRVISHPMRLTADNAAELIAGYDIVCDGSDNPATRFTLNDACVMAEKTLVSAAVIRMDGQLYTFKPHEGGPCYRCLYGAPPPEDVWTCTSEGVLGSVAGVMGTLQATEVIKEITGAGESLAGSMLIYDARRTLFRKISVPKDPGCPVCSG